MSVISITAQWRKQIEQLADILVKLALATSLGVGVCVRLVAMEKGFEGYRKPRKNKQVMIAEFLENVFRRFTRKQNSVVLAVIEGGVIWHARQGKGVDREELDEFNHLMNELGFDISHEVNTLILPDLSRICEPWLNIITLFDCIELHKALKDDCFNALERFAKAIQDAINEYHTIGQALMNKAFGKDVGLIRLNKLATKNNDNEQDGFRSLTIWAMSGIRNLYSHGDITKMTDIDVLERLAFVIMLSKRLDAALHDREKRGNTC